MLKTAQAPKGISLFYYERKGNLHRPSYRSYAPSPSYPYNVCWSHCSHCSSHCTTPPYTLYYTILHTLLHALHTSLHTRPTAPHVHILSMQMEQMKLDAEPSEYGGCWRGTRFLTPPILTMEQMKLDAEPSQEEGGIETNPWSEIKKNKWNAQKCTRLAR
jgi:hypothetical protein